MQRLIFKIVFVFMVLILLWMGLDASFQMWKYFRLEKSVLATDLKCKVIEISSSEYALKARYSIEVQGKKYKGKSLSPKPYHLNALSAQKAAQNMKTSLVWYDPANPSYNFLEKAFPYKKIIYFSMVLGIFLYLNWRISPGLDKFSL